jgi:hypothetical protein
MRTSLPRLRDRSHPERSAEGRAPIRSALLLLAALAASACDGSAPAAGGAPGGGGSLAPGAPGTLPRGKLSPPPPLPGVAPGEREWFWRDVLAAAQPGEAPPDSALLALASDLERLDALADLAPRGDARALTTLMAALKDPRPAIACAAASDLGTFGFKAAIPRLVKGIGPWPVDYDAPDDIAVRAAQASALARLGNPSGMPLLLLILAEGTSLQAPDASLPWTRTPQIAWAQELALPGVRALAGQDFGFRSAAPVPERERIVRAMTAWWEQRRLTLWAAAPLDDPGQVARVQLLVAHLGAYQLRQIDGARWTLAQQGPAVLPYLVQGLAHADDYVRVHSLEVMEMLVPLGDSKLHARLASVAAEPLLNDPAGSVAAQAARVAGAAGVADQLIVAARRRREPDVLLAIVDALGQTRRPEARDELLRLSQQGSDPGALPDLAVALEAALLACDASRPADAFLGYLASPDADIAYAALQRLMTLTGGDQGLDPSVPPEGRAEGLARARAALEQRRG